MAKKQVLPTLPSEQQLLLEEVYNSFMNEFQVLNHTVYAGIGSRNNKEDGISLFFDTENSMDSFPFKEAVYKEHPVYKQVVGVLRKQ